MTCELKREMCFSFMGVAPGPCEIISHTIT